MTYVAYLVHDMHNLDNSSSACLWVGHVRQVGYVRQYTDPAQRLITADIWGDLDDLDLDRVVYLAQREQLCEAPSAINTTTVNKRCPVEERQEKRGRADGCAGNHRRVHVRSSIPALRPNLRGIHYQMGLQIKVCNTQQMQRHWGL